MATLTEMISGKPKSPRANLTPEVEARLMAVQGLLPELETQVADLVLRKLADEPDAAGKLDELNKTIVAARLELQQLESARILAKKRDARALSESRARIRQSQLSAMDNHCRSRLECMEQLCAAIETAAKAYRGYLGATEKMVAALPIGCSLPNGFVADHAEALIAAELYRHSGVTQPGQRGALPGARCPDFDYTLCPDKIEPAVDVTKRSNEYLQLKIEEQLEEIARSEEATQNG